MYLTPDTCASSSQSWDFQKEYHLEFSNNVNAVDLNNISSADVKFLKGKRENTKMCFCNF
jgi:hypothetical protein